MPKFKVTFVIFCYICSNSIIRNISFNICLVPSSHESNQYDILNFSRSRQKNFIFLKENYVDSMKLARNDQKTDILAGRWGR
jgi:hypothetical protein